MANRNRTAGHAYELQIVNELKEMGYDAVTSRAESRNLDNKGVDIVTDFPFHIQCKNSANNPDYHKLHESDLLPEDKPFAVFHKKTERKGNVFRKQGEYVILKKEDFYRILGY